MKDNKIFALFLTFLKIGAFTFGGGYAMIPLIERELADNKKWITKDEILDTIAISESTPGPIAVNIATFVGYNICGGLGAFFATLGIVMPSFVIICILSILLNAYSYLTPIKYAFFGIRAGVLALVVNAFVSMFRKCPKGVKSYVIMALAFLVVTFTNANVIFIIIGCALLGLFSYEISRKISKGRAEK